MRTLKAFGLLAILLAVFQSSSIRSGIASTFRQNDKPSTTAAERDQGTFNRLCPLLNSYLQVDGAGKRATATGIRILASTAAKATDDPTVKAFLTTVPAALDTANNTKSAAARALIKRECRAHSTPLKST